MSRTVLIIDDSPTVRSMVRDQLHQAGLFDHYLEAGDGEEGLEILLREQIDVVLCDLDMPGISGFELLRLMQRENSLREVPVIMLTGHDNQDEKIHGLELGASDYVTKPFDPAELLARVKVQLKIKTLQDKLRRQANTDVLTGLFNRRYLFEELEKERVRAIAGQNDLSIAILDIDHFKKINDTYGHQVGDQVLIAVAERLCLSIEKNEIVARFGGEEFVVVLPGKSSSQARDCIEKIRRATGNKPLVTSPEEVSITLSAGVATLRKGTQKSVDALVKAADEALYLAKESGRNRVEIATEESSPTTTIPRSVPLP
ncbi:MAG: diguanylate cyclase response regulator [Desulfuromonas sp.]|nr:MAG: diguanylate cyclase response regulator [Desulfuromonas sp.]